MNSLELTDRINKICDAVKSETKRYPNCVEVYLFGSFIRKLNPNDIDVLIVYDELEGDVNYQIDDLSLLIENVSKYPVDVTALSKKELKETFFLDRLNNKYLRII